MWHTHRAILIPISPAFLLLHVPFLPSHYQPLFPCLSFPFPSKQSNPTQTHSRLEYKFSNKFPEIPNIALEISTVYMQLSRGIKQLLTIGIKGNEIESSRLKGGSGIRGFGFLLMFEPVFIVCLAGGSASASWAADSLSLSLWVVLLLFFLRYFWELDVLVFAVSVSFLSMLFSFLVAYFTFFSLLLSYYLILSFSVSLFVPLYFFHFRSLFISNLIFFLIHMHISLPFSQLICLFLFPICLLKSFSVKLPLAFPVLFLFFSLAFLFVFLFHFVQYFGIWIIFNICFCILFCLVHSPHSCLFHFFSLFLLILLRTFLFTSLPSSLLCFS